MKKNPLIIFTILVFTIFTYDLAQAKDSYFEEGKKLFNNKNIKITKIICLKLNTLAKLSLLKLFKKY